ncbi:serine/threonine protein kinase [Candidatus Thiomargarita nelsonii]|uniref:Serine/threonine protein kinase n=1 Tax=Candidatus Thiomargarita nelsonii TaxID=1003181 RepID=A0A176S098_9GAMM|nr:serine/threonine protein kinase [Candidatus Thiomargarita nelsonii]
MGGTVFMVMEFLSGMSLKPFIKSHSNGISLEEAKQIIQGMGKALSYAHKEGIAHLDFKPGNVFYETEQKNVKLIDFGIARLIKQSEREETLYDPGDLSAFTEPYASREMFLGLEPTPGDDIYALACVTYELLSGKHPFNRKTAIKAEKEKLSPRPISGLSSQQNKALLRALAFRRENRTPTVDEFLAELFPEKNKLAGLIIGGIVLLLAIFGGMALKQSLIDLLPQTPENVIDDQSNPQPEDAQKQAEEQRLVEQAARQQQAIKKAEVERLAEQARQKEQARQAQVTNLLQQCQTHFDAKRFTTGSEGTALVCYQEVLRLEPNNPNAKAGLKAIEDRYVKLAEKAFRNKQVMQLKTYLRRLEKVNPNSPALARLDPKKAQ